MNKATITKVQNSAIKILTNRRGNQMLGLTLG